MQPILCFHGWQDNCSVFDRLIPFLPKENSYLAIDIPGHGWSSSYSLGMHYGSLDMLWFIENVRRVYGWQKISIIGHSMMGAISFMYAAVFPDLTNFVVILDNFRPAEASYVEGYLRNSIDRLHIEDERIQTGTEPPSYDYPTLIKRIHVGSFESVKPDNCKYLIPRGVLESSKFPGRYYFKRDARVKHFNGFLMAQGQYLKIASKMTVPILYLYGDFSPSSIKDGVNLQIAAQLKESNPNFQMNIVPGNHHFFLNQPETCYKFIVDFISKWGGLKNKL